MRNGLTRGICVAALCLLGGGALAQARPPIEAFANLPAIADPQLSPDGRQLAYIQPMDGKPAAVVAKIGAGTDDKRIVLPSTGWTVSALRWVKNDHIMVNARQAEKVRHSRFSAEWTRNISMPVDGGKMVMMLYRRRSFPYIGSTVPIADIDLDDPDSIFMPSLDIDDSWTVHGVLLKANVQTGGAGQVLGSGPAHTVDWVMDGHGNIAAHIERSVDNKTISVFSRQPDGWQQIWSHTSPDEDESTDIYGLSEDGKSVVLAFEDGDAHMRLRKVDLTGGDAQPILEKDERSTGVIWDPWTSRVVGTVFTDDVTHPRYFDPQMQAFQLGLEKGFPGKSVAIVSYDLARDKVIAGVSGSATLPTYYFIDRTTHQAVKLASSYPDLEENDLGQTTPYVYKARDGLEIHGYLTLPPGKAAHNLPLVVMPHGGPEARDEIGFDWWVQFMANRGYAVLQPNYRGSTGYGRPFVKAGFHQWGLKMQDDITDGVQKLIQDGTVDTKRVCIVGASYGGYAALVGVTRTPDLYACAISYAGLSDLQKLIADDREFFGVRSSTYKYLLKRIGDPIADKDQLEQTSPVNLADKIKVPVLLMHGDADATVPVEHSELMNAAMLKAGKDVRFVRFKSEDHYMIESATRARILQETEAFLFKAIGN